MSTSLTDDRYITELIDLAPIKTWSLIVTLFGDLQEEYIQGKQINWALKSAGIKPEAIRVALYRLRKDGWIVSTKSGREVRYRLSLQARNETNSVYERIYNRSSPFPGDWKIILHPDLETRSATTKIDITKNIALLYHKKINTASDFIVEAGTQVIPSWFENKIVLETSRLLAAQLATIALNAPENETIRLLILHRWRLLALKDQTWAHISLFPDGPLARCHTIVSNRLAATPRLSLER